MNLSQTIQKSFRCCMLGHTHAHSADGLSPLSGEEGAESRGPLRGTEETMKGFKEAIDLPGTAKNLPFLFMSWGGREVRRGEERRRRADREGHSRRRKGARQEEINEQSKDR